MSTDLFAYVQRSLISQHLVHVEHWENLRRLHVGEKSVQCFQKGVDEHLVGKHVNLDG
jgi:hypothetical protein